MPYQNHAVIRTRGNSTSTRKESERDNRLAVHLESKAGFLYAHLRSGSYGHKNQKTMILPSDEDDHVCIETKFQTMISYFNFSTNRLESTTLKSMAHPKNNNMQRSGGPGAIPAYVFR